YRKARAVDEDLSRSHPDSQEFARGVVIVRSNLGNLLRAVDRTEESLDYYDKNIAWLEEALAKQPKNDLFRQSLFLACLGRGLSLMKLERRDEARGEWLRVVQMSQGKPNIMMRLDRQMPLAYLD